MLITKFNRMIHNRVIWAIVGGFVALSMVYFVGPSGSCTPTDTSGQAEGRLFDKKISAQEFRMARSFEEGMREPSGRDNKAQQALRARTWRRLVALEIANRLGLTASDQEVAAIIQSQDAFRRNGIFNKDHYRALIQKNYRTDLATFETYLRQDVTLRKLASAMQSAVWSSPAEVSAKLAGITDQFVIQYAKLNQNKIISEPLRATTDEARAFYDANPAAFTIPERVSVQYVSFPIPAAADMQEPADAEIEAYYQANLKDYSSISSNGAVVTVLLPEARTNIIVALREKAAHDTARDAATEFSLKLQPDRDGKAPTLQSLAETNNLTVGTTPLFSKRDVLTNLNVGAAFTTAAFNLDPSDPYRRYSEPISGEYAVYVSAPLTREPTNTPAFESVSERALHLASREKMANEFRAKVSSVRNTVQAAVKSGTSFANAMRPYSTGITTTESFSLYGDSNTNTTEEVDTLKPHIMNLQKGELTEPVETESASTYLLAFIQERTPGELPMGVMRPELISAIEQQRVGIVFGEWQDFALKHAGFKDERPIPDIAATPSPDDREP